MSWKKAPLGDFMASRTGSVDPAQFPDETFELFSIPAYDKNRAEIVRGSEIGSAKQVVSPGDVLLSRIVPHIRRAWVVNPATHYRLIGSGEWIPFRSPRIAPYFLRHLLITDWFNAQLMRTVAGVGGSLLRARPEGIARIEIPLPPLPEQRRIAAILDHATPSALSAAPPSPNSTPSPSPSSSTCSATVRRTRVPGQR